MDSFDKYPISFHPTLTQASEIKWLSSKKQTWESKGRGYMVRCAVSLYNLGSRIYIWIWNYTFFFFSRHISFLWLCTHLTSSDSRAGCWNWNFGHFFSFSSSRHCVVVCRSFPLWLLNQLQTCRKHLRFLLDGPESPFTWSTLLIEVYVNIYAKHVFVR